MANDSSTSRKRRDHHDEPIAPRAAARLEPVLDRPRPRRRVPAAPAHSTTAPASSRNRSASWPVDSSVSHCSPVPTILAASPRFSADHRGDLLLDRAGADELADLHRLALPDPERAVGGLVLDRRVPPAVDVDHVVGRGQVQPGAAGLQRQHEQRRRRGVVGLEAGDHRVACRLGDAAVQEQHLAAEPARQVAAQHRAELGVLGEQQRPLAGRQHLVQDLVEPLELARPAGQPAAVAQEVRRVVADLLQLGHRGQHQAAPLDALGRPRSARSMSSTTAW